MKNLIRSGYAGLIPWMCLVAAGLVAAVRWFHPAVFSIYTYLILAAGAGIGFTVVLLRR